MTKDIPFSVVIHNPILLNCYQVLAQPILFCYQHGEHTSKQLDELMTIFVQFIIRVEINYHKMSAIIIRG